MLEQISPLFRELFQYDEPLGSETGMDDVPRWDSLQHVLLVEALEKRFDVKLSMDEVMRINTVGTIIEVLEGHGVA